MIKGQKSNPVRLVGSAPIKLEDRGEDKRINDQSLDNQSEKTKKN